MKKIYVFSGLGADERAFQNIDFSGLPVTFIRWIKPHSQETIEAYTTRLLEQIKDESPILIGLSFGGMVAIEMSRQIPTEKVILIASAKTRKEIPFYYRWSGTFRLHRLLPAHFFTQANSINNWLFGAESAAEKELLKAILADTDPQFFKWAIDKITRWENTSLPENTFHIHGTNDRILPFRYVKCNAEIQNGGHLMTINRAKELNEILHRELNP